MNQSGLCVVLATAMVALVACGDSSSTSDGGGGQSGTGGHYEGGGTGDPAVLVGTFEIDLTPADASSGVSASTSIVGKVSDGPSPSQLVWETQAEDGSCTLLTPRVPFCAESCGGSAVCVEDDTCASYPTARSVGDVTVTGVATTDGATSFVMSPVAGSYQAPAGTTLAYPPFAQNDAVSIAATGAYFGAFSIATQGIQPMEMPEGEVAVSSDSPVALSWTPGSVGASIHVKLDISHHGGTKGMIECDTDDSGSLEIPASLVSELVALGVAGYPTIIVTRHVEASTTIEVGRVDLAVRSSIERPVAIDGVTSCTDNSDCPDGQTCQSDLTCQ